MPENDVIYYGQSHVLLIVTLPSTLIWILILATFSDISRKFDYII